MREPIVERDKKEEDNRAILRMASSILRSDINCRVRRANPRNLRSTVLTTRYFKLFKSFHPTVRILIPLFSNPESTVIYCVSARNAKCDAREIIRRKK